MTTIASGHEEEETERIPSSSAESSPSLVASTPPLSALASGVKFSPDGLCVLTSVGSRIRLYNTHDSSSWRKGPALECLESDVVRSMDWYPWMNSQQPETCCFLTTSRHSPSAKLYDAYTGLVRASYCPISIEREEPIAPMMTKFMGPRIVCGGFPRDRCLVVFDAAVPGKHGTQLLLGKTRKSRDGQKGLVSSLGVPSVTSQNNNLVAVGTYAPGSIYLYDIRSNGEPSAVLLQGTALMGHGHKIRQRFVQTMHDNEPEENIFSKAKSTWFQKRVRTGITQIEFGRGDTSQLFTASRNSDAMIQWDLRMMQGLRSYEVKHDSNQRLGFCLSDGGAPQQLLHVGDRSKSVLTYNTVTGDLIRKQNMNHVVNDVSVNPSNSYMAISLGERVFVDIDNANIDENSDDDGCCTKMMSQGVLQLWKLPPNHSNESATT